MNVLSDGRGSAGHSGKTGEGFAERARGDMPHSTESGYSVPVFIGFPDEMYAAHKNVCTKVFSSFGAFYFGNYGAMLFAINNKKETKGDQPVEKVQFSLGFLSYMW